MGQQLSIQSSLCPGLPLSNLYPRSRQEGRKLERCLPLCQPYEGLMSTFAEKGILIPQASAKAHPPHPLRQGR